MKQFLFVAGVALFSFFLGYFLDGRFAGAHAASLQSDCYQCDNDAFNSLSAADFDDGIRRYKTNRSDIIDNGILRNIKPDARNCWYSLDTLKKFICVMEKYAGRQNIPVSSLGIRFHYAVYPDNQPVNPSYARLHTLFLAATINRNNINEDFDPRYLNSIVKEKGNFNEKLLARSYFRNLFVTDSTMKIFSLTPVYENRVISAGTGQTISVMDRNQGQLCPNYPNCPPEFEP